MIAWLRRLFARRMPDPTLRQAAAVHAARTLRVDETVARASAVAGKVVKDSREDLLRASFSRAGERLAR